MPDHVGHRGHCQKNLASRLGARPESGSNLASQRAPLGTLTQCSEYCHTGKFVVQTAQRGGVRPGGAMTSTRREGIMGKPSRAN